jgi:hypothetical protein
VQEFRAGAGFHFWNFARPNLLFFSSLPKPLFEGDPLKTGTSGGDAAGEIADFPGNLSLHLSMEKILDSACSAA